MLNNPIFIVGSPRSGTTLLQCMLCVSDSTFSLPETHYFSSILPVLQLKPNDSIDEGKTEAIMTALIKAVRLYDSRKMEGHRLTTPEGKPQTAADLFVNIIDGFRPDHDLNKTTRLIEKTPNHIFHMHEILECFPTARFVNIVRDPRDVASSLYELPTAKTKSMIKYANIWKDYIQKAMQFESAHHKNILSIRYEDLVANTEKALVEICGFLNLDFQRSMMSDFSGVPTACILPHEKWKDEVKTGAIKNKSGIWRKRIDSGQAWIVEQETAPFFIGCRYIPDAYPSQEDKVKTIESESRAIRCDGESEELNQHWLNRLALISNQVDQTDIHVNMDKSLQ